MTDEQPCENTDRELWRAESEEGMEYYAPSLHVTIEGNIGIDVGGTVFVDSIERIHKFVEMGKAFLDTMDLMAERLEHVEPRIVHTDSAAYKKAVIRMALEELLT